MIRDLSSSERSGVATEESERLRAAIGAILAASGNPEIAKLDWQLDPDGGVTLRGVVSGFFAKQMAQVYVSRVDGVTRIENLVEVR